MTMMCRRAKPVVEGDDASSLALREYARRRASHRASLSGLQEDNKTSPEDEQMGQLMRAVSALQKHGLDTADSNLLRDRVERTYAKPWQVNARIDEATSVPPPPPPQTEEETTRLKATKNYEKPWRHMAKPPATSCRVRGDRYGGSGARRRPWSRPRRPGRRRPTWSARRPSRTTCPSRHADHRWRRRQLGRRAHAAEGARRA